MIVYLIVHFLRNLNQLIIHTYCEKIWLIKDNEIIQRNWFAHTEIIVIKFQFNVAFKYTMFIISKIFFANFNPE